ncbi:hypothetical protein C3L23_09265 [Nautilia sp. PV-1]|uniref:hypothetical protein n=1 Tax=Nautilia sp. PV-1 TaxID=2579250 RepID=UPI000FDAD8C3|nr:hypothetical protein [Nautilia sp. PV-1]AZV47444.1 hypothetical protein C3L23_09265 [Nautilia sp. PV-1]
MLKKAFNLWLKIAIFMLFVIIADFMIFEVLLVYWHLFFYMKEIFITIFAVTIIFSIFAVGYFFEQFGIEVKAKNRFFKYIKIYFSVLWRALIIVTPVIGLIAYVFHGSIGSRIATIFIEILAGFPAIYWYLKKLDKK